MNWTIKQGDFSPALAKRNYWIRKAICKPAVMANGLLEGKPIPKPSTRQELADYLNGLARKIHIERTATNPGGYFATPENIG